MPLPDSVIAARARREERKTNRPKVNASRYSGSQRDADVVRAPNGMRFDKPTTAIDAYKSDMADQAFKAEKRRSRGTMSEATSMNPRRFDTTS